MLLSRMSGEKWGDSHRRRMEERSKKEWNEKNYGNFKKSEKMIMIKKNE